MAVEFMFCVAYFVSFAFYRNLSWAVDGVNEEIMLKCWWWCW